MTSSEQTAAPSQAASALDLAPTPKAAATLQQAPAKRWRPAKHPLPDPSVNASVVVQLLAAKPNSSNAENQGTASTAQDGKKAAEIELSETSAVAASRAKQGKVLMSESPSIPSLEELGS